MKAKKPILLVVMDGVGFSKTHLGDAVGEANTPTPASRRTVTR